MTNGTGNSITIIGFSAGTYTFSVSNADGCSSPSSGKVIIKSATSPNSILTTITSETCGAANGKLSLGTVSGGTSPFTYSVDGSAFTTTTQYSNLTAGLHTINVKDNNECTYFTFVILQNMSGPTALEISATDATCSTAKGEFSIGTVTGGNSPFTYSVDGSDFTQTIKYTNLTAGLHIINVKDNNGCNYSTTATILNISGPTDIAIGITNETCEASNGVLNLGPVTGGTPPYTYSVDGSAFTPTTRYSNLPAGSHTIYVKDYNDCNYSTAATIQNISGPTAVATLVNNETCGAANGELSLGAVTGGIAPYSYSVDGSAFTQTLQYSNLTAGSHNINVKDNNGCNYATTAPILNMSGPTAIATQIADETCSAANGALTLGNVTGGTSPYTYSVDGSAFTSATSYSSLSAGSHTVTVKDNNGCTYPTTAPILNISGPTAIAAKITDATCGASSGIIAVENVTGGTSPYTYSLDGSAYTGTASYSGLSAGVHTFAVKDKNGCTYSTPLTIVQLPATTASISGDAAICAGSSAPLTLQLTGAAPWSIIYTDGETTVPLNNIMSSPFSFKVSPIKNTTYTLTSITDANCNGTFGGSAIIAVAPRVIPTFTPLGPFLLNTVAPSLPGLSLNGISGQWSPSSINTASSGMATYTFTPDPSECASNTTMSVTINIQAVIAENNSVPVSSIIQAGACQQLNLNGSKSIGDIASYQWSLLDIGGSLTQQTGVTTEFKLSGDYGGSLPADFRIKLRVTDTNGYVNSDTVTVKMNPLPVAKVASSGTLQKDGTMIVDGSGSDGAALNYRWSTKEGKIVGPDNQPTARFEGAGMYRLEIMDVHGCQSTKDFKFPIEVYRIVANPDYYRITWAQDTAMYVLANDSVPPGYNSIRVIKQPTLGKTSINPDLSITYSPTTRKPGHDQFEYEICNIDLCDTAIVNIDIDNSNLIIPQGFSPNGDSVNDFLKFEGLDKYKPSGLMIYTRSGQEIYTNADYQNEWDGRMSNHQLVPTGVYYYILKLGQTNRVIKGFLYIGY